MTSTTGGGGGIRIVDPNKGYGYITPDEGGKDIYFELSVVEGAQSPEPANGWIPAEMKGTARTATKVAMVSRR